MGRQSFVDVPHVLQGGMVVLLLPLAAVFQIAKVVLESVVGDFLLDQGDVSV